MPRAPSDSTFRFTDVDCREFNTDSQRSTRLWALGVPDPNQEAVSRGSEPKNPRNTFPNPLTAVPMRRVSAMGVRRVEGWEVRPSMDASLKDAAGRGGKDGDEEDEGPPFLPSFTSSVLDSATARRCLSVSAESILIEVLNSDLDEEQESCVLNAMRSSESRLARKSTGDQSLHVLQVPLSACTEPPQTSYPILSLNPFQTTTFLSRTPFLCPLHAICISLGIRISKTVALPTLEAIHGQVPRNIFPNALDEPTRQVRKRSRNGRYTVKTLGKEGCSGDSDNDEEDSEDEGLWKGGKMDKGNDEEMEREWEGVNWSGGLSI
ncbi:hypothetical protein BT96DRAFT_1004873 [Gymnopus androsaceus JB14]|uniref:Uncharacterized protein n=1 Tax=Gymnopus androsaceus JB14 TaxID=1447944 RepID=A0A6A4GQX6_9AGAR|nr:hypothetical protein BT96DRAFT_1004873 [Gymnopus androsaceus JB14]